jgi:hypothetical protein
MDCIVLNPIDCAPNIIEVTNIKSLLKIWYRSYTPIQIKIFTFKTGNYCYNIIVADIFLAYIHYSPVPLLC